LCLIFAKWQRADAFFVGIVDLAPSSVERKVDPLFDRRGDDVGQRARIERFGLPGLLTFETGADPMP
jgi:hypothetical protein